MVAMRLLKAFPRTIKKNSSRATPMKTSDAPISMYLVYAKVGNPLTDDYYDSKGLLEYAWSHSVISDEQYNKAKEVCDFKELVWSNDCNIAMNVVFGIYKEIDIYNIYAPICLLNIWIKETKDVFEGYDPCYSSTLKSTSINQDVQSTLHANINTEMQMLVLNGKFASHVLLGPSYYCIKLQVGNPLTDDYYDSKGLLEHAWSHSVISDEQYNKAKEVCDFKELVWSNDCNIAMNVVFGIYKEIDIYNIYAPICLLNSTSSISAYYNEAGKYGLKRPRMFSEGYDPCYSSYAEKYFNKPDVQSTLHANINTGNANASIKWQVCKDSILNTYHVTVASVLPIYKKLIQGGLKIWIYRSPIFFEYFI
ncbi:uncharacterized protein LOC141594720 [Silene latifolia]|uniref:uncharacterized protein LOC141594720 n=1 Tax=Silene latifolia TaxID=37657 RepID=UPI003D788790